MTTIRNSLPRYLDVANWLYNQHRAVSAREVAQAFGVSSWAIERDFAKIRTLSNIIFFDEQQVSSKGGKQYLLRVLKIHPYEIDEHQQLHPILTESHSLRITWRDLLSRNWNQLVKRDANYSG